MKDWRGQQGLEVSLGGANSVTAGWGERDATSRIHQNGGGGAARWEGGDGGSTGRCYLRRIPKGERCLTGSD